MKICFLCGKNELIGYKKRRRGIKEKQEKENKRVTSDLIERVSETKSNIKK